MFSRSWFVLSFSLAVLAHNPFAYAGDALDEVNQARAARGLRPFQRDEALSQGAQACANARARGLVQGHTKNDFAYLPPGASAKAGGAAAWPKGMGWGSCCTYEDWGYAGAAYSIGRDGKRYMQLFVSNRPNSLVSAQATSVSSDSAVPGSAANAEAAGFTTEKVDSGWVYFKAGKQVGFLRDDGIYHWLKADGSFDAGQKIKR